MKDFSEKFLMNTQLPQEKEPRFVKKKRERFAELVRMVRHYGLLWEIVRLNEDVIGFRLKKRQSNTSSRRLSWTAAIGDFREVFEENFAQR